MLHNLAKTEVENVQYENEKDDEQLTLAQQIAKERFLANQDQALGFGFMKYIPSVNY